MQRYFIALGFVFTVTASSTVASWVVHMEKTIKPGDSVTIYCENPVVNPQVTECADGELVVSPTTCSVSGFQ